VFQSLLHLLGEPPLAYLILFAIAAGDAVFPAFPSETAAITAGLLSAVGDLNVGLAIASAASGAFVGDNSSYLVGRFAGSPIRRRYFGEGRGKQAVGWAERQLEDRGGYVIVVARFIPGGRTAATFTAGTVRFSWWRFAFFAAVAGIIWATYAVMLGYFGGRMFEQHPWLGLLVALGIAFTITAVVEGRRHLRRK
jgi:membrane protein DedA with SNARE-associated domain